MPLRSSVAHHLWRLAVVVSLVVIAGCADDSGQTTEPTSATTSTTTSSTTAPLLPTTQAPDAAPTTEGATVPPEPAAVAVTAEMILNAELSVWDQTVQLVDGETLLVEPVAGGFREDVFVTVVGSVIGDLTGDGVDDAAAVLTISIVNTTGRNNSLIVFSHDGTTLQNSAAVVFADRGRTHDLRIEDSTVLLHWSEDMFLDEPEQTRASYQVVDGELVETSSASSLLIEGNIVGLRLGNRAVVEFGSSLSDVAVALSPLLGEPSRVGEGETCWGQSSSLEWEDGEISFWVAFLEDEFYQWGSSDSRVAGARVVTPGASRAWLEQWFGDRFETAVYELSGQTQVLNLDASVYLDETESLVRSVGGLWESDDDRLHTVILDPFENDVWCGD